MRVLMHLSLPVDGRMLPRTRRAVDGYLEELNLSPEERHDVILAIDEACANVIQHAFPDQREGTDGVIDLTAVMAEHEVNVTVEDHGVGIPPAAARRRELAPVGAVSGRGLQIIRELMTTVELETNEAGGTRLTMSKQLSAEG